jgi:acetolactate synthase-1/2/3 large subunit
MKVSDYIARSLAEHGIRHIFLVTGGGAMHLNDAIGREERLRYVCCHHEQACAMAAESYFRLTGRLAAVNVTTGPGGTNTLTGVWGAHVDSQGMIVISGQVKFETTVRSTPLPLRQLGDQEIDIVRLVEPITKYAHMVTDPLSIRYHLEKALYLAQSGRPGPVWLDVPMNVQGASVEPGELTGFDPSELEDDNAVLRGDALQPVAAEVLARLQSARRPVILAGSGVRLSGARDELLAFAARHGVPIVTAWNAHDLVPDDFPTYVGRPGTIGDRAGNFAVQNADCVLSIGCRLNVRQISYNWENWARNAFRIIVDIDPSELQKPTLSPDLAVCADALGLLQVLASRQEVWAAPGSWLDWCLERRRRYPVVLPEYSASEQVNPYVFVQELFAQLDEDEVVVTGDGTACVTTFQAAVLQKGQRLYTNSGCASMGYDLPAAVGAALGASDDASKRVVCLAGDGSVMMNLQELQTIATQRLPIKIFVLNNRGYHSIRQTQAAYFPDNIVGCGEESGLSFPDFEKLAGVWNFPFVRAASHPELPDAIARTLSAPGACVCEVMLDLEQQFAPKLSSRKLDDGRMVSSPLEDMAPFLSREELSDNMLVPAAE